MSFLRYPGLVHEAIKKKRVHRIVIPKLKRKAHRLTSTHKKKVK